MWHNKQFSKNNHRNILTLSDAVSAICCCVLFLLIFSNASVYNFIGLIGMRYKQHQIKKLTERKFNKSTEAEHNVKTQFINWAHIPSNYVAAVVIWYFYYLCR